MSADNPGFSQNFKNLEPKKLQTRFYAACCSTVMFTMATPPLYTQLWTAGLFMGGAALISFIVCAIVAFCIYKGDLNTAAGLLGSCFPGASAAAPRCLTLSLSLLWGNCTHLKHYVLLTVGRERRWRGGGPMIEAPRRRRKTARAKPYDYINTAPSALLVRFSISLHRNQRSNSKLHTTRKRSQTCK